MIKVFIIWITVQLMITGMVIIDMNNEIIDETHECEKHVENTLWGAAFPLIVIMDQTLTHEDYCNNR